MRMSNDPRGTVDLIANAPAKCGAYTKSPRARRTVIENEKKSGNNEEHKFDERFFSAHDETIFRPRVEVS